MRRTFAFLTAAIICAHGGGQAWGSKDIWQKAVICDTVAQTEETEEMIRGLFGEANLSVEDALEATNKKAAKKQACVLAILLSTVIKTNVGLVTVNGRTFEILKVKVHHLRTADKILAFDQDDPLSEQYVFTRWQPDDA